MNKYYIHIEAFNMDAFIQDTNDLSTIRGSGLLLLDIIDEISKNFKMLKPVSTGASKGLFSFEAKQNNDAKEIVNKIKGFLADPPNDDFKGLRYATFLVDYVPAEADFQKDKEILQTFVRWEQYKNPTIVVPEINAAKNVLPCHENRMLPGIRKDKKKNETVYVSESVKLRRQYGRKAKHTFYQKQLEKNGFQLEAEFVKEFEELTKGKNVLANKMAVIYADGNRFSNIQLDCCKTQDDYIKFDEQIKNYRAEALKNLIDRMLSDPSYQNNGKLRLETLLWGGDEFIWVVPAWKGFETLKLFYEISESWCYQTQEENIPLKHASGIVFCNYKAPIHAITKLCKEIAEEAKACNREINLFQYLVLESFDHIGQSLENYRKKQFPVPDAQLSLDGNGIATLENFFKRMKQHLSRRQVHEMAEIASHSEFSWDNYCQQIERIQKTSSHEAQSIISDLEASELLGQGAGKWIHIRDYIVPDETERMDHA
jgi:hypothetical protein